MKQEFNTFRKHMGSPQEIWSVLLIFLVLLCCLSLCLVPNIAYVSDLSIIDYSFGSSSVYLFAMIYFCWWHRVSIKMVSHG